MAPAKSPPTTTLTQNTWAPPLESLASTAAVRYDVRHGGSYLLLAVPPLSVAESMQEPVAGPSKCGLGHAYSGGRIGQGQPKGSGPGGSGGARGHVDGRRYGRRPGRRLGQGRPGQAAEVAARRRGDQGLHR